MDQDQGECVECGNPFPLKHKVKHLNNNKVKGICPKCSGRSLVVEEPVK